MPNRPSGETCGRRRSGRAWTPRLAWPVMATKTSLPGKRERARTHGSGRNARTALRHHASAIRPGSCLAVAVIAGLFAMHGFGMHGLHSAKASSSMQSMSGSDVGTSGPDTFVATSSTARRTATGHDAGVAMQAVTPPAVLVDTSLRSVTGSSHEPSGGAALVGMCLTLLAFGVLWLLRWTGGRLAWTICRRAIAACVAQLVVTAHDLSPPSRAKLSIWRC